MSELGLRDNLGRLDTEMTPQELGRHTYISLESSFLKHSKIQHFENLKLSRKKSLLLKDKNLILH